MNKIEIAKKLLNNAEWSITYHTEALEKNKKRYIGEQLEYENKDDNEYIANGLVYAEALKLLIANEESKNEANAMDNMADEIRGMGKSDVDVIEYFNEGSSAQQIAQELGMSIDQVEDIISKHEQ